VWVNGRLPPPPASNVTRAGLRRVVAEVSRGCVLFSACEVRFCGDVWRLWATGRVRSGFGDCGSGLIEGGAAERSERRRRREAAPAKRLFAGRGPRPLVCTSAPGKRQTATAQGMGGQNSKLNPTGGRLARARTPPHDRSGAERRELRDRRAPAAFLAGGGDRARWVPFYRVMGSAERSRFA